MINDSPGEILEKGEIGKGDEVRHEQSAYRP